MRSALLVLFVALLGSQAFASEQALRACGAAAESAVGLEALEEACPGVADGLQESGYSAFIGEAQGEQLRRESFGDVLELWARYQERSVPHAKPDPAAVASVLSSLPQPPPRVETKGWLELLWQWLQNRLSDSSKGDNWLARWLEDFQVSSNQAEWLLIALGVFIVGAAGAVLFSELRASGVLARRGTQAAMKSGVVTQPASVLTLADLDAATMRDRAALLLKILVTALHGAGRLRAEQALTHRELGKRASFDDERQRAAFGEIATLAESTLYGGYVAADEELDRAVASGRNLYSQLSHPVGPRT